MFYYTFWYLIRFHLTIPDNYYDINFDLRAFDNNSGNKF